MKKSLLLSLLLLFLFFTCNIYSSASIPDDIINASLKCDINKLKTLLKTNPSLVNFKGAGGRTPLFYAALCDSKEVVEFLISQGACIDEVDNCGETPLHISKSVEVAEILISHGADANRRNENGETHLHIAIENNNIKIIEFLISRKVKINAKDFNGMTPLHYAVRGRRKEAVELLLAHGADINATNKNGETPLSFAVKKEDGISQCIPVKSDRKEIIKALIMDP